MFELDLRSRRPIYEQLVDKLKQLIINDVLKQDEQLPSVRTLAQQLSINPNTIQKAYRELEAQGYIYSVKGKGSFVSQMVAENNEHQIKQAKDQLKKQIAEALFIGLTVQDLKEILEEVIGGEPNDSNAERK
ncbi:GntR family transcriptional regulator [Gracilibacillus ureilyticus]|uniref:GntR family transcriptional regulator n=1 Tax=Gracilibacillus ureilyticus TaxID=531814 RepID=A0A1H9TQ40_9BACI|nr:GntR family transcriptional regulator [Gracilibacillus ureilyticus]SER98763.1 GntR family transcriptional regulator [Gracilibacillus ureilyticus]